jgi:NosR/NirI family nitrite reductase transcriptional regulator
VHDTLEAGTLAASRQNHIVAIFLFFLMILSPRALSAQEFSSKDLAILFPGAAAGLHADRTSGEPPAARVTVGGALIGYAFSTRAVSGSVGYSGRPLDIHIGLTREGRISGARLVAHKEPILVIGIASEELEAFVARFINLDIRGAIVKPLGMKPSRGRDHVAGATVSSRVMHDAVLRSARAVALSRGIIGGGTRTTRLDRAKFEEASWSDLVTMKAIARRTVLRGEVAAQRGFKESESGELFIDIFTALATPPTVGQNLLGRRSYEQLTANIGPQDTLILIAANGLYSIKGTAWRRNGVFDRLQIVQGGHTIQLHRDDHHNIEELKASGAPVFREIGVFHIAASTGFDPAQSWRLELQVSSLEDNQMPASFTLDYDVPQAFLAAAAPQGAAAQREGPPPELWQHIWRERLPELVGLVLMLCVLTIILFGEDALTRRRQLYRRVRITFLVLTFLFLGLYAGAQISIVNVLTFTHTLLSGFKWDLFLLDPLVFTLWSFVALAVLFWGRGVFCGWLCPFGALQELLNEAARKIGIKQLEIPWALHERLWPIKYVLFLVILGASLQSILWAYQLAEVEPFKTAIILKFFREWPYVLYVLVLLAAGLFVERFYCRYLCPLGAALAIPAKLKLFEWLKRRPQCGRECRICNTTCTVQAINPLGQINPNECIYCLRCQANYFDVDTCLPLKMRAARRACPAAKPQEGGAHDG